MTEGVAGSAARNRGDAPLVGRGPELSALHIALEQALASARPRIVSLLGPAGIGKSRTIEEFFKGLRADDHLRVYRNRARQNDAPYGLFVRLLRKRFSLGNPEVPPADATALQAGLSELFDQRQLGDVCHVLGRLLGLEFAESPLMRALEDENAGQLGSMRRVVLKSLLEQDAARGPLCLSFEDLQFADPESLDLLGYLLEHLSGRILIVCSGRLELLTQHEKLLEAGRGRHLHVELTPLSAEHSAEIMRGLLSAVDGGPPEDLISAAVGSAAGIPRLLEQMLQLYLEHGVLRGSADGAQSGWSVDLDKLPDAQLPLSIDDAVTTRIAALSTAEKRALEHAAAMGSVFWLGGLLALARSTRNVPEFWVPSEDRDAEELRAALDELVQRDYILKLPDSTFPGETEFVFKHNLERERITQLTSPALARKQQQIIADWLAQKEGVRSQPEYCAMLAQHLEAAANPARAALAYLEAGDLARQSYSAKTAYEYYRKGLDLLGEGDALRRIEALHNHGDVSLVVGKTDEALNAFREMRRLSYRMGLMSKAGAAHNRIGRLYRETGALTLARQHLDGALELFRAVDDERGIAACHDDIGKVLWTRGEYDEALEQMKTALEIRKKLGDRRSIALSLNNIGLVWMEYGRASNAAEALEAALEIRREIGDVVGIIDSLTNLGRFAEQQGERDLAPALALFREAYDRAREMRESYRTGLVLTHLGDCQIKLGDHGAAVRSLKQAEELCEEIGDRLNLGRAKRSLAKAYLHQGELRKARDAIKQSVDIFGQIRSKSHLATALRTLGEVTGAGAWGSGYEGKAVDYFMRSIAMCKEVGNELEVAKSYRAFSAYVTSSPHYKSNPAIQREAQTLSSMAQEIFARHRISRNPSSVRASSE